MYLHRPKIECRRSPLLSIGPSIWSVSQLGTMIGTRGSCSPMRLVVLNHVLMEKVPRVNVLTVQLASQNRLSSSAYDN
jgi:hypothetical protein